MATSRDSQYMDGLHHPQPQPGGHKDALAHDTALPFMGRFSLFQLLFKRFPYRIQLVGIPFFAIVCRNPAFPEA